MMVDMDTAFERLEREVHILHAYICEGLGDPKRVLILHLLSDRPHNVTELTETLGVSQPTISHHLRILRDRGLVVAEREGSTVVYSLADHRIMEALDILRAVLADVLSRQAGLLANSATITPPPS